MADYIKMPTLGFDMEEGTMGGWLKNVGDPVAKGDILAEIESDKVTQELQARSEGVLLAILANEGDNVPVGANLGIVGAEGEDISGMMNGAGAAPATQPATAPEPAAESAPATAISTPALAPAAPPSQVPADNTLPGGVRATPVARRIAQEKGIDLSQVVGSGPDGRIRKADVENFVPAQATTPAPTAVTPAPVVVHEVPVGPNSYEEPLSRMRKAIARRMTESKTTVPHFQVTSNIDMEAALALRKQINASLTPEEKVSVNDLVVKAAALALREFPNINASFAGDKIVYHNDINIGSAVAVEGGLLTIVQKNTDISTMSKVAIDHKEMIGRAREGKVMPADVEGSTFTVSNLGAFEVEQFVAIINPPNAAILAVASAKKVPVIVDDEITIGVRMKATISADHRVTDGAEAAQYMQTLKQILENPMRLLL
ncbi:MAG: dihydrolipoamide acetyltransferase family protein [Chloroflexota bacterium]